MVDRLHLLIGFCLVLFWSACDKAPQTTPMVISGTDSNAHGFFICNEGNFNWGNASLSFYHDASKTFFSDVYKPNNNKSLGDVLQSMEIIDSTAYLVVNNSGKIEMINPYTFKSKGNISGFTSPRYLLKVGSNKAYVSDLYEDAVWIVNLDLKQISGKIHIGKWTEGMAINGNDVYVCGRNSYYIYKINCTTDQLTDSLRVGYGAQDAGIDSEGKLWILTYGSSISSPSLLRINVQNFSIEKTYFFAVGTTPSRLNFSKNRSTLYWLNNGIWKHQCTDELLPGSPIVAASGRNFYGLGIHHEKGEIYASDAKDFVQKSEVYRFNSNGEELGKFLTGINTGFFYNRP